MKEWLILVKKEDKTTVLGQFNKMQTMETIKEYMKTDYEVTIVPIKKEMKQYVKQRMANEFN